jgi:hypothetical protein
VAKAIEIEVILICGRRRSIFQKEKEIEIGHHWIVEEECSNRRKRSSSNSSSSSSSSSKRSKHTCSTIALELEKMERMTIAAVVKRAMVDVDLNLELVKREQL